KKLITAPALTGLVALPIAGYAAFHLMQEMAIGGLDGPRTDAPAVESTAARQEENKADADALRDAPPALEAAPLAETLARGESEASRGLAMPAPAEPRGRVAFMPGGAVASKQMV